jgi:hypothetical protein
LLLTSAKSQEYRKGTREEFVSLLTNGTFDGAEAIFRSNESTAVRIFPIPAKSEIDVGTGHRTFHQRDNFSPPVNSEIYLSQWRRL